MLRLCGRRLPRLLADVSLLAAEVQLARCVSRDHRPQLFLRSWQAHRAIGHSDAGRIRDVVARIRPSAAGEVQGATGRPAKDAGGIAAIAVSVLVASAAECKVSAGLHHCVAMLSEHTTQTPSRSARPTLVLAGKRSDPACCCCSFGRSSHPRSSDVWDHQLLALLLLEHHRDDTVARRAVWPRLMDRLIQFPAEDPG